MEINTDIVDHAAMGPPSNASGAMSVSGILSILTAIGGSIADGVRTVRRRIGSVQQNQDNSPSLFGSSTSGGEHQEENDEEGQFPDWMEQDSVEEQEQAQEQEEDFEGMEQDDEVLNNEEQEEDDVAEDDTGTWIYSQSPLTAAEIDCLPFDKKYSSVMIIFSHYNYIT